VVEVATELFVDDVEGKRIDGRVDERQTEADSLEDVPVGVVADVAVVPVEQVDVARQPAGRKDDHEQQDDVCDLQLHTHTHTHNSRC